MPLNTENHVQSQDSPRGTCKLYSATGTNFSPTTLVYSRRADLVERVKYTMSLVQMFLQVLRFSLCQYQLKQIPRMVYELWNRIRL